MIVQVTLTLTRRIRVDSVVPTHSISQPRPVTKKEIAKNKSLFTDDRNCKVKSLVNPIPSRFLKFALRCWKEHLHTGLNVFRRFSVCHKFLSVLKLVIYKIYFRHQSDFPFRIYKSVANANSKQHLLLDWDNTDWGRGKPLEQIL